jgi:hypothetical protein
LRGQAPRREGPAQCGGGEGGCPLVARGVCVGDAPRTRAAAGLRGAAHRLGLPGGHVTGTARQQAADASGRARAAIAAALRTAGRSEAARLALCGGARARCCARLVG